MLDQDTQTPFIPQPPMAQRPRARWGTRATLSLALAASTVAGSFLGSAVTAAVMTPPTSASAAPIHLVNAVANPVGSVYQKVGPSIVEIVVASGTNRRGQSVTGSGSGIVLDTSGRILTNEHVVSGATDIQVKFSTGEQRAAQVVGTDRGHDLAVIKVSGLPANIPAATLGDSDQVQVGETAIAIGSPFGLEATVTQGIISAVHRDWQPQSGGTLERDMLQTDAAINPGNSGGALLNANGEVIGITSAIESPVRGSVGVGFAIPINTAKRLLSQLEAGATLEPVWLGIAGTEITPDVAQSQNLKVQHGVLIDQVVGGSPAEQAQLQANDVITALDGAALTTFAQLADQLAQHKPGDTVKVTVDRGGQALEVTVTLQARPANQ